jgi:hypothetical protein
MGSSTFTSQEFIFLQGIWLIGHMVKSNWYNLRDWNVACLRFGHLGTLLRDSIRYPLVNYYSLLLKMARSK